MGIQSRTIWSWSGDREDYWSWCVIGLMCICKSWRSCLDLSKLGYSACFFRFTAMPEEIYLMNLGTNCLCFLVLETWLLLFHLLPITDCCPHPLAASPLLPEHFCFSFFSSSSFTSSPSLLLQEQLTWFCILLYHSLWQAFPYPSFKSVFFH